MPRGLVCCVKMSEEELRRKEDVLRMAQMTSGGDSISVKKLDLSDTYSVGINLRKPCRIRVRIMTWCCVRAICFMFPNTYSQDQWCCDVS